MPLTELMNYFNDQLQQRAKAQSLPKTGFFKVKNNYWARFGNLILGSRLNPLLSLETKEQLGYDAELLIRTTTGNLLDIDSVFTSLDDREQVVHLDRLVRTLHSLNYLQQYDGRTDLLSLSVHPRHIISVATDHGKIFEKILSDCGLGPERVLLTTRLLDSASLPHFHNALGNYQRRGYLLGISLSRVDELDLLKRLNVSPYALVVDNRNIGAEVQQFAQHSQEAFTLLTRATIAAVSDDGDNNLQIPA
ncbi:hypothetical protein [Cellvibrio japonicus]|uniref:EAL domain-containing protein n=1 Tax=Cellvibrio japonicus (strain Ueda107) TaxID=498211 RepID=B3PJC7_CELJU|nr:hypothetical protein [Cellvibrio japonicus]ACE84221.1 hypothetical protein CJA_2239 [Cellvibrio japonicus Ueda107]QEI12673.1 hypothetical protein FY117_10865 [Cellvibrio japonicus]QEI16247.1 hypothetical protein FY116_10870 [Cellvibrio japonicus]QEI19825.1 hypothetical protein FY115_10865 [Cellvibrio japonicus]